MDGINTSRNNDSILRGVRSVKVGSPSAAYENPTPTASSSVDASLNKLSGLVSKAESAGNDLRQDKIERARRLLEDPNWLNDQNLDRLAAKLSQEEDF